MPLRGDSPDERSLPADRPLSWRPALFAAAAGLGAYALFRLLAGLPDVAERAFVGIDFLITRPLSLATGLLPFAVSELLLAVYLLWLGAVAAVASRDLVGGRRRWRNALAGGGLRIVRDAGVIVFAFYTTWGFNYARPDFSDQAGWPRWSGIDVEEITALSTAVAAAVNARYLELHGAPDAGAPTTVEDPGRLEAAIDTGWVRAAELLELPRNAATRYGRIKRPFGSGVLLRLGILGIYSPFTAEANVPRGIPAVSLPTTMAHEKAHQRGITSEADAGFLAYIVSGLAPDPLSRYAAALYAHNQLFAPLHGVAPDVARQLQDERLSGVQRDIDDRRAFSARFQGTLNEVGTRMNDRYLTTNLVAAGVGDYRRSAWLIVAFARQNQGDPLPPIPEGRQGSRGGAD